MKYFVPRLLDTPWNVGDWRCSWPTPVALWSSVGGTFLLPLFSSLAPGFWDSVPDSGKALGSVRGGTTLLHAGIRKMLG